MKLEKYQEKFPNAIKVRKTPSEKTMEKWYNDGGCKALDGCWVEPDGRCPHGHDSWLLALGWI